MKQRGKRWLAVLLCLTMAMTLLPGAALAAPKARAADLDEDGLAVLSAGPMKAYVDESFPRVVHYVLQNETVVDGQTEALDTLKLNGVAVKPVVTSEKASDGKSITYVLTVSEEAGNTTGKAMVDKLDAEGNPVKDEDDKVIQEEKDVDTKLNVSITARITVGDDGDNTLAFYIDSVDYLKNDRMENPLESIEIPNHSLVSLYTDGSDQSVAVTGGTNINTSINSNDKTLFAHEKMGENESVDFFAAFLHSSTVSAGLASNSEYDTDPYAGRRNNPVRATFSPKDGGESIGLSSTLWYYDRKVSSINPGAWENHAIPADKQVQGPVEQPFAKVVLTCQDENGDGKIDWQDGAIVYRNTIMHKPVHSERVRDAVNLRISMNFGGQAQHPFLFALDNVKRVALHTDGLGQMVLLKGYASEGHDSGHPDYWNVGERMGGVADMITMMDEGNKLGAQFGIHVNCSEFYPEAKAFDENRIGRYNSDGSLRYGWNWIDQGVNMNIAYDFATGDRAERFQKLYDLVGDRLSFVYVDVWGNGQHGINEDAWMTRQLTKEITENKGWRITQEWSFANPYDSTFQHWTSDYTYGDYSYKGWLNSSVLRFLLNGYKDAFPADFPTYGGACNAPLLGGPAMQGFEGWQKDDEYDLSIYNTYNQMVYTKFLQHYDVMQWINAENTVAIPFATSAGGPHSDEAEDITNDSGSVIGGTRQWRPEMQIVLQSGEDTVVVTRGLDAELDTEAAYSLDNEVEYRSRVITLNGKVILTGAPASAGEDKAFPKDKATLQYLIPWFWDAATGERVSADQEKLYHWNAQGGESTWELPDSWAGLSTVLCYELSDQGRGEAQAITVTDGKITLSAKANTPYVVVKGEANQGPQITYSTGLHVQDAGFNMDMDNSPWTSTGSTERVKNPGGISAVKLDGEASVSQVMTDLKAGQKYVTYVGVDNLSDGKASITITDETGAVLASNYTMRSIAQNYVSAYPLHTLFNETTGGFNADRTSRFQNMYIFFTPEAGKTYTMTLSHEGSGEAYFAGVRTLETQADNFTYDAEGNVTGFFQDFEHSAQGEYPFVVSGLEGVEDNRQHLSQLHAPYTQGGWDGVKLLDDVIDGQWSLKVGGLDAGAYGTNQLVMQTIPQNFRFEPGKTYTVEFDYEMGSTNTYMVCIGDGECVYEDGWPTGTGTERIVLAPTLNKNHNFAASTGTAKAPVGHVKFTVVGSESGQTWIGLVTDTMAETDGMDYWDNRVAFGGYKDFVLDNLRITLVDEAVESGSSVTATAEDGTVFTNTVNSENLLTKTTKRPDGSTLVRTLSTSGEQTITSTDASGKVLAQVKLPGEIPAPETKFTDVPEGHWSEEGINQMAALGLVGGTGDGSYNRQGSMKRADLATILFRLSNGGDGYELPFPDVDAGKYYAGAVAWAAGNGIVTGRNDGTFGPSATITREQLAAMLCRYADLLGVDTTAAADLSEFSDSDSVHSWATDAMAWCVAKGILQGNDGALAPNAEATRAEVAVMLQRFLEVIR